MVLPVTPIDEEFSREDVVSAIRGAQADTIRSPEFMKRSAAAGVIAYWAFLAGRKVIYFGRRGEFHIEEFPPAEWSRSIRKDRCGRLLYLVEVHAEGGRDLDGPAVDQVGTVAPSSYCVGCRAAE